MLLPQTLVQPDEHSKVSYQKICGEVCRFLEWGSFEMLTISFCLLQSRILLSVLSFRLNQRYVEGNPPFIAIDIDVSDSAREGCVVSTLTITSEPKDWRGAVQVRNHST